MRKTHRLVRFSFAFFFWVYMDLEENYAEK